MPTNQGSFSREIIIQNLGTSKGQMNKYLKHIQQCNYFVLFTVIVIFYTTQIKAYSAYLVTKNGQ